MMNQQQRIGLILSFTLTWICIPNSIGLGQDATKILDLLKSSIVQTLEDFSGHSCFATELKIFRIDETTKEHLIDHVDQIVAYLDKENFVIKTNRVEDGSTIEYVNLANSRYFAQITRVEGGEWTLMKVEPLSKSKLREWRKMCALYAPIDARIANSYFPDVLQNAKFTSKLLVAMHPGKTRIELEFPSNAEIEGEKLGREKVILQSDINSPGLIEQYEDSFAGSPTDTYTFVRTRSNPETVRGKTYWRNTKTQLSLNGSVVGGEEWTFDLRRIDDQLPKEEFYLKHYGISEPSETTISISTVAIIIAAVGVIGGIVLTNKLAKSK